MAKNGTRLSNFQESKNSDDSDQTSHRSRRSYHFASRGPGQKQKGSPTRRADERGFVTVWAIVILVFTLIALGISQTLIRLTDKIDSQIQLDRLTGEQTLQLRAVILTLEESESRLKIAKAALIAGCFNIVACPELEKAFEIEKKIEESIQKAARTVWRIQKLKWQSSKPIFGKSIFPDLDKTRSQGEAILEIQTDHLVSASRIWKGADQHAWKVAWIK